MAIRRFVVTAAGTGTITAYSPYFSGNVCSISYIKSGTIAYSSNPDFAITVDGTGEGLWTQDNIDASTTRYPRAGTHTTVGVAAVYASGGEAVLDKVAVARDRVKVIVSNAGTGKSGIFHVVVDDGR